MANYVSMYLGSSSTFNKFIDLHMYTDSVNLLKKKQRAGLTKKHKGEKAYPAVTSFLWYIFEIRKEIILLFLK
jgi:hypothetical protein